MNHFKQIFGNMRKKRKVGNSSGEKAGLKYMEKNNSKNAKRENGGEKKRSQIMIPAILFYYDKVPIIFL